VNQQQMLRQVQQMQAAMAQAQQEIAATEVTGSAGGGMVTVEADGKGQLRRVKIDPSVVNPTDVEMLEDLITVAVGDAQKKAAELASAEMGKVTGGLNLPFKLPF